MFLPCFNLLHITIIFTATNGVPFFSCLWVCERLASHRLQQILDILGWILNFLESKSESWFQNISKIPRYPKRTKGQASHVGNVASHAWNIVLKHKWFLKSYLYRSIYDRYKHHPTPIYNPTEVQPSWSKKPKSTENLSTSSSSSSSSS